jgi:hypothetical protein
MKEQVRVLILGVCLTAISASAQYVLREPFVAVTGAPVTNRGEYRVSLDLGGVTNCTSIGGEIVGFAMSNTWTVSSNELFKPQTPGLSYSTPQLNLSQVGGCLTIDRTGQDDVAATLSRRIQNVVPMSPLYFSALMKATADPDGTALLQFNDVDGVPTPPTHSPYMWGVGFGFTSNKLVLVTRNNADSRITHTVMENYVAGQTYFVVVKIVVDANIGAQYNDNVKVWVNPTNLLSNTDADLPTFEVNINTITSNLALLIDEVRVVTSGFGNGVVRFDEISFGKRLEDVVRTKYDTSLILADDFSTSSGQYLTALELNGQIPWRPGFSGAWRNSSSGYWKPYAENLGYTNGITALVTSGGSVQLNMPSAYDREIFRSTTNIVVSSSIYISALLSFDADGDSNDFAYIDLYDSKDTTNWGGIQWGLFNGQTGIRCRSEGGIKETRYVVGSGAYTESVNNLYVLKIEKNVVSFSDRVTVYLNPTDLRSEAANVKGLEQLVANIMNNTVLDTVRLRSTNITNGLFKVDEIRVGTSWAEVVPYVLVRQGTMISFQ